MADMDAREQQELKEEEDVRGLYSLMEDLERKCYQDERVAKEMQETLEVRS